jgi:hypothetical protein
MLLKNTTSQGIYLYAYVLATGAADTGDAANITGHYTLDGTDHAGFSATNPTEIGAGVYWQPLAQAETNGNAIAYRWASSTSGVQIAPVFVLTTGVSLPVAAPAASGGLLTLGTGTGQLNVDGSGNAYANVAKINSIATASVTTVSAYVGTTQPVNFSGTGASAYVESDLRTILGTASAGAAGYVGIDWAHVNAPTTAVNLSGTTISTSQTIATVTNQLTAAAIATGIWQDTTAGDFTTASSIGKSLYTAGAAPGASAGIQINGTNAGAVSYTSGITTNITGNLSGSVGSVTGNVGGNVTGSVGSISGVTFPTHFSLLAIDGSGDVTFNNTTIATATAVTNAVTLSLTQALNAARALDAIADTSLTLNDALQCAVASVAAQVDASSGTSCVFKTASTGTTLRTKTLTLISTPATVPDKAV